jgi:hypothetical protein
MEVLKMIWQMIAELTYLAFVVVAIFSIASYLVPIFGLIYSLAPALFVGFLMAYLALKIFNRRR